MDVLSGRTSRTVVARVTLGLCLLAIGLGMAAHAAGADRAGGTAALTLELRKQALLQANDAVIGVRATAVDDARSIESLGRQRRGSGVLIGDDGLVLTIGYLVLEADHVDLQLADERVVPARVVAYDLASGFGLLQALAPLKLVPAPLGTSASLDPGEPLLVASGGEAAQLSLARLVSSRAFSGYWEYHIDGALFTAPPRVDHSGAGLFNADGELVGIGSLVVADALGPGQPRLPGNMFVPIDLLKPILAEMRVAGMSRRSARAWLGVNCIEIEDGVRVIKTSPDSPAEQAGLLPGDQILRIDGAEVRDLASLYKTLWQTDRAEREVTLEIRRGDEPRSVTLRSLDRMKTLSKPQGI